MTKYDSKLKKRAAIVVSCNKRMVLTLPEIAQELAVSRRFVEMEISRGRIAVIRLSARVVRVSWQEFLRYLAENTDTAARLGWPLKS